MDHSIDIEEENLPVRSTVEQTVNFIVKLCDEAIACEDLPWNIPSSELSNWAGRLTKASAYGLKVRVLLFAASPLFNSDEPYLSGEASSKYLTWYGNYDASRWQAAADAAEDFFKAIEENGYYKLVEVGDYSTKNYREAFREAYYQRGSTEMLIESHRNYYMMTQEELKQQALAYHRDAIARYEARVRALFTRLLLVETTVGLVALFLSECCPHQLIAIFGAAQESEHYTAFAVRAFRIYLCMVVLACVNKACFIFLQAMGKTAESTALSMVREVVFGVGFALLLPRFFGLDGVLYSMPVSDVLTFAVSAVLIARTYRELRA